MADTEKQMMSMMVAIIGISVMAQVLQGVTPQPQFVCPTCGASFSTQAELDAHILTAHPSPLGYDCPYCEVDFATLDELISHVASDHPDKPPIQSIDITWE